MIYTTVLCRNYHIKTEVGRKEVLTEHVTIDVPIYHAHFTLIGSSDDGGGPVRHHIGSFVTVEEVIEACAEHAHRAVKQGLARRIGHGGGRP
jgi:hypothetical protein